MNRGTPPDNTNPATTERWTFRGIATVPPGRTAAEQRSRHAEGRAGGEEERFARTEQVGRQPLGVAHAARRVERVVGGRHRRQVERKADVAD